MGRVAATLVLLALGVLPRAGAGAPLPEHPGLVAAPRTAALCGARDAALDRVAQAIVEGRARGVAPATGRALDAMLREAGSAHVWPSAWAIGPVARADDALVRLQSWSAAKPSNGQARCGVALWHDPALGWHAAAVRVDAFVALTRLPAEARRHQWIELEAQVLAPLDAVTLVLLGPRGRPRRILASTDGQTVRSRFSLDQAGRWLVQLVGESSLGPVPVLEASILVDAARSVARMPDAVPGLAPEVPPADPVSAHDAGRPPAPSADPAQRLARMLNEARRQEGARPLLLDAGLARLAADHAAHMAGSRQLGHDIGDGTPAERLETANLEARLVGENAAAAANTEDAHRALWSSPSHRENMLDDRYRRVGVGTARDASGSLWVAEIFAD